MTVSSQIAASTRPYGGRYVYGAAKAGVNRLMRSLATDLKDNGVTIAVVHPGHVQTDMGGPMPRSPPQESAAGTKSVIDGLSIQDTGEFFKWNEAAASRLTPWPYQWHGHGLRRFAEPSGTGPRQA